ncbi:MAG: hypothetical protein JRM77_04395 [Nitrososphaerota archaeon]|nr:hypothetical protein [Nitrososphaerota archaeon]
MIVIISLMAAIYPVLVLTKFSCNLRFEARIHYMMPRSGGWNVLHRRRPALV